MCDITKLAPMGESRGPAQRAAALKRPGSGSRRNDGIGRPRIGQDFWQFIFDSRMNGNTTAFQHEPEPHWRSAVNNILFFNK